MAVTPGVGSGGGDVSVDSSFQTLEGYMETQDASLAQASEKAKSGNTVDTMNLEMSIQKWSLATDLESQTIKSVANAIRSIIRNVATE